MNARQRFSRARFLVLELLTISFVLLGCSARALIEPTAAPTASHTSKPLPTATIGATATPLPPAVSNTVPFLPEFQVYPVGDLVLIEYPLPEDQAELDGLSEIVNQIVDWQRETAGPSPSLTVSEINDVIQPFGYRIVGDDPYRLYQGGTWLRDLPEWMLLDRSLFSVNRSGTDFVWLVHDTVEGGWLIHGNTIETAYSFSSNFFVTPQYIGDDLITLQNDMAADESNQLQVLINDQAVYAQKLDHPMGLPLVTDCPVENLRTWNEHWILDLEDQVVMDGEPLNKKLGYEAIFEWLLFRDRPLYFFQDQGRSGLVYDGHELPVSYDEIGHTCWSVNDMRWSPRIESSDTAVNFFARRDGTWYYVELKSPQ